jgi:hypothetical protein
VQKTSKQSHTVYNQQEWSRFHQEKYSSQLFLGILLLPGSGLATFVHLLSIVGAILGLGVFPMAWQDSKRSCFLI